MTGIPVGDIAPGYLFYDVGGGNLQVVSAGSPLPTTATLSGSVTIGDLATATAADPVLVEGTEVTLSLDLSGHQRVKDAAAITAINLTTTAVNSASTAIVAAVNTTDSGVVTAVNATTAAVSAATVDLGQAVSAASVPVVLASDQSILPVQTSFLFRNITTATTTVTKTGAGVLRGVTVNTKGTIASTITIYDNTAGSGTKIGTIDSLNLAGQFEYDIAFATGLTLVTTGTVAPDITVAYR